MLRVHCVAEDFLRVTIADQPMPLLELGLALGMIQRRDPHAVFTPWRRRAGLGLPRPAHPMLNLISPQGAGPLFLDPPTLDLDEGLDQILSTSRVQAETELHAMVSFDRPFTPWIRQLAEADRDAWRVLEQSVRSAYGNVISETWPRLHAGFQAETAWRSRILAQQGLYATLGGLSPSTRWNGLTLESELSRDVNIHSQGLGIVLQPSLFWDNLLATYHPDGRIILIYPAVTPLPLREQPSSSDPLTVLLGGTRAQALQVLVQQQTTTTLARELGVTVAAASMQAKTLREAGLIVSQREGKARWHWCTPLGLDLLRHSTSGAQPAAGPARLPAAITPPQPA
jgi:DNA-binding transcriptional ArsR family regulator